MTTVMELVPEKLLEAKAAEAAPDTHDLIRHRWSPRAFSDRDVSNADLRALLDAARWAPSSYNEQPWRFIVGVKSDGDAYGKLLGTLMEANRVWAEKAPVLLLTVGKRTFSHNGSDNRYAMHDAGMALANLMIQATAMGLSVHAMGGFDLEAARREFNIPEDYELGAAAAIGYPGSPADLPEHLRQAELAPRSRKPLSDLAFGETWGQPVKL
jgi:nitroreductase